MVTCFWGASQQPLQHGAKAVGVVKGTDVFMARAVWRQNRPFGEGQEDAAGSISIEKHGSEMFFGVRGTRVKFSGAKATARPIVNEYLLTQFSRHI